MSRALCLNSLLPTSMSTTLLVSSSLSVDMMPPSTGRSSGVLRLAMGARFDFDEDVAVLPIAAVEKLMGNAGFAPDRVSRLFVRFAHTAVIEGHLVPALRQRHDEIGQQMLMPWLTLPGVEGDAPHPHRLVLEHDLVANRSQHAHRCSLPAMIRHRSAPASRLPDHLSIQVLRPRGAHRSDRGDVVVGPDQHQGVARAAHELAKSVAHVEQRTLA